LNYFFNKLLQLQRQTSLNRQHYFDLQPLQVWGKGGDDGPQTLRLRQCPLPTIQLTLPMRLELDYPCPHLMGSDLACSFYTCIQRMICSWYRTNHSLIIVELELVWRISTINATFHKLFFKLHVCFKCMTTSC